MTVLVICMGVDYIAGLIIIIAHQEAPRSKVTYFPAQSGLIRAAEARCS